MDLMAMRWYWYLERQAGWPAQDGPGADPAGWREPDRLRAGRSSVVKSKKFFEEL